MSVVNADEDSGVEMSLSRGDNGKFSREKYHLSPSIDCISSQRRLVVTNLRHSIYY